MSDPVVSVGRVRTQPVAGQVSAEIFGVERRSVGESGARRVTVSTEKPVRAGGGVLVAAGGILEHYMANPVVPWAHDYQSPPVAKCVALSVETGVGITAEFEFPPAGIYALADTVRGLWDAGFINACSIGFMPIEWKWAKASSDDGYDEHPVYSKWEMFEFSLVSIPRDREALRRAVELVGSYDLGEAAPINKALLLRGLKAWREVTK